MSGDLQRVSPRQLAAIRRDLSERDMAVLRDVSHFRLLSGRQLARLHFPTTDSGARTARRVLARLQRWRLLSRLQRRIGGLRAGSEGYVYGLGPVGDRLLRSRTPRRRVREVSDGFLLHTLAVGDVYTALRAAEQAGQLDLIRVEAEPQCWRPLDGAGWLKPDLLTVVATAEQEVHSFVEVDLGSEHGPALLRKLALYEQTYRSGREQHQHGLFPRVVWLVPDEVRLRQLQRLIAQSRSITQDLHAVGLQGDAVALLSAGGQS